MLSSFHLHFLVSAAKLLIAGRGASGRVIVLAADVIDTQRNTKLSVIAIVPVFDTQQSCERCNCNQYSRN